MSLAKRDLSKIDMIVIHCSATKASMKDVDAAWIDREHRKRGFLKIGYHFFIKRDGQIETGRAIEEVGSHAVGFNQHSIGICMAGGLDEKLKAENNYTGDQWVSLAALVGELRLRFPNVQVVGHRDLPKVAKDCPCFSVKEWYVKSFPKR
jgi:N-acetylmuramoyl-L-alanine amidase